MLGIFFVIVNEMIMAPWLYIDMCCTWLKWNPLHEMNEKMKTLTYLLWLFALCYNILISKENFCGTCILNQNFILRDIMTQLVKVTNVWKIEGYQELYTFIINWQPLKFQYESPKKSAKWVLSKISIPVIDIYVYAYMCILYDCRWDCWCLKQSLSFHQAVLWYHHGKDQPKPIYMVTWW